MGAVHPRPGDLRHQRRRADPSPVGRRRRQPPLPPSAAGDDGRHVAAARRLRPGRLDLVSRDGQGLLRPRDRGLRLRRNGTTSFAGCPGSTRSSSPAAIPATPRPAVLMPFLAKVAEVLHRSHPRATLWVSPQGFNQEWLDQFLKILKTEELALADRRRPRSAGADQHGRAAQGRAGALPDSHLSRHHPQPAVPVPRSRLGPGLLAHRGTRGHQPPAPRARPPSSATTSRARSASSPIPRAATTT